MYTWYLNKYHFDNADILKFETILILNFIILEVFPDSTTSNIK